MADEAGTMPDEAALEELKDASAAAEAAAAESIKASIKKAGGADINVGAVYDALEDGNKVDDLSDTEKEVYDNIKPEYQSFLDKYNDVFKNNPPIRLGSMEADFNENANKKGSRLYNLLKKIGKWMKNKFNGPKMEEEIEKDEGSSKPDEGKIEERKWLKDNAMNLMKLAGEGIGAWAVLSSMAEHDSGCFVSDSKSGSITKLACQGKTKDVKKRCECGAVTGALPTDLNNVCTVPETDTCPDYQYMYKRVTIFDELGRIGHDALNVIEGGEEIINDIVNFFKKYGLYFAIGLFVLVAIPLVVAIVKKL